MAVYVLNSWLLLQDAQVSERKRDLAQVYIAEHLPDVNRAHQSIVNASATPLQARNTILGSAF
jgi:hypothetical protein